jgi:hypothetical protein
MHCATSTINQEQACEAIEKSAFDFTAKLYAAMDLARLARQQADAVSPRAIEALKGLLLSSTFNGQRQRLFLFREAANVLASILQLGRRRTVVVKSYAALRTVLRQARDRAHLAAAEALGTLPLAVQGPRLETPEEEAVPALNWRAWLRQHDIPEQTAFIVRGRSLTAPLPDCRQVVVKLAQGPDDGPALQREVQWLQHLSGLALPGDIRFDVPTVLAGGGATLFRLEGLPAALVPARLRDPAPQAIGFIASRDYFGYPNSFEDGQLLSPGAFLEVMGRSAYLLGFLAARGVVHAAPIALFHNRVQQQRRRDGGVYEWYRAGRLDRWLVSCAYPNFGISGLRDFEHFSACDGQGLTLFRRMGNHFISLLLVAGSYFRAQDPQRVGRDAAGRPVDARDLFDERLLGRLVQTIFGRYCSGFTGRPVKPPPLDMHRLIRSMIAQMGVDHHMEEYLRVADQQQMSATEFEAFLLQRGYSAEAVAGLQQGAADLVIQTGPHLGAFNRGISLPELIEAGAAMAAVCVAERFLYGHSGPLQDTN